MEAAEQAKTRQLMGELAREEAKRKFDREQQALDMELRAAQDAMLRKIATQTALEEAEIRSKHGRNALNGDAYERVLLAEINANLEAHREKEQLLKEFISSLRREAEAEAEAHGLIRGLSAMSGHDARIYSNPHTNNAGKGRGADSLAFLDAVILNGSIDPAAKVQLLKEYLSKL
jgi:hypothetical protein